MTIVLSVAAEIFPVIKTGGLADVAGALPAALAAEGVTVRTLVPGYPAVMRALRSAAPVHRWDDLFGGAATLVAGRAGALDLLALDAPHLFDRPGNPYSGPDGRDWPDNAFRFAALGRAAAAVGGGAVGAFVPDIVHAHDWQAGLAAAYLRWGAERGRTSSATPATPVPATVMTIHNLAFQGQFPAALLAALGFPRAAYGIDGLEYYGSIGFLKAGVALADRVTTVSPTYAAEIRTQAGGMGMDGLLRSRGTALSGILNGIDTAVWDPAADKLLAATFDARRARWATRQQGGVAGTAGPAGGAGRAAVRRGLPPDRAEGDGPACGGAAVPGGGGVRSSRCWAPASRRWRRRSGRRRRRIRGRSA